jgi:hypothetical protein
VNLSTTQPPTRVAYGASRAIGVGGSAAAVGSRVL